MTLENESSPIRDLGQRYDTEVPYRRGDLVFARMQEFRKVVRAPALARSPADLRKG